MGDDVFITISLRVGESGVGAGALPPQSRTALVGRRFFAAGARYFWE